jgi:hypothetical protein
MSAEDHHLLVERRGEQEPKQPERRSLGRDRRQILPESTGKTNFF